MAETKNITATGIETAPGAQALPTPDPAAELSRTLSLPAQHLRLTQVILTDQTDAHNELVHERHWLLHPSEKNLALQGNLFVIDDLAAHTGHILIKLAPLPSSRPAPTPADLRITPRSDRGFDFTLLGPPDSWQILQYHGGPLQRTAALHNWQKSLRPATPNHTLPSFLSNTWGDRSRDSRINASFIATEIDAAAEMGVDIVQIDDGWQKGTSSNSALAAQHGGVWEGFWHADPHFWHPHPDRFPQGLQPLVDQARSRSVHLGLWFAPDSFHDFANWQKDADRILQLFTTLGIQHFKIDGVNAKSDLGLANLHRFFQTVLDASHGQILFDLDITAALRPGYFGALNVGPLFIENRYTDWHNYWPHQTLRNLWKLASWVDPRRLRMEFLNHTRNAQRYPDDPLAPCHYPPETLFATVMFANPLGWFEVSNLPPDYRASVSHLVAIWKTHRQALFAGTILPIAHEPDGFSYTGFLSLSPDSGYVLIFRELNPQDQTSITLPNLHLGPCHWHLLAGAGTITSTADTLHVKIPQPLSFLFARFTRTQP